jgi:hypothetical protein
MGCHITPPFGQLDSGTQAVAVAVPLVHSGVEYGVPSTTGKTSHPHWLAGIPLITPKFVGFTQVCAELQRFVLGQSLSALH